jgi:hypothetical protein
MDNQPMSDLQAPGVAFMVGQFEVDRFVHS